MQSAPFDGDVRKIIIDKWKTSVNGAGVFVRSSSNAEDLPDFSGAGLYDTVPNVKEADKLIEAVKTVWASLWNFEAYEARERNFIYHVGTYMGVLVQVGVDAKSSGVMITKDPFDNENKGAIYISAKRGLGIKVVDGKKVADGRLTMHRIALLRPGDKISVTVERDQQSMDLQAVIGSLRQSQISAGSG